MKTKNKQKNKNKIPDGWEEKKLGEICEIISGGTPSTDNLKYWNGNINWITPTEIVKINGKYIFNETGRKISEDGLKNSSANLIPKDSLILCSRATIGVCAINKFQITTNQGFKNIIPKKSLLIDFLYYKILLSKNNLIKISSGSTFLEFSKKDIKKLKINIPSLEEQKRIVGVLEVWDGFLEKLGRKIEIKKEIKKGLMQNLLTGKIRIGDFSKKWEEKKLGEICEIKKGQGLSKKLISETGKNKCILYGEIYTTYIEYINKVKSFTDSKGGIKSKKGDILIPGSTTTSHLDLATATTVFEDNILLGGDINILRKINENDYDNVFLSLYLTHARKHELARLAQGVTIVHLYGNHFKKLNVVIPSLEEQKAIATILTDADDEIDGLSKKKKIVEEQKRFLLNNLISGEVRVVQNLV